MIGVSFLAGVHVDPMGAHLFVQPCSFRRCVYTSCHRKFAPEKWYRRIDAAPDVGTEKRNRERGDPQEVLALRAEIVENLRSG